MILALPFSNKTGRLHFLSSLIALETHLSNYLLRVKNDYPVCVKVRIKQLVVKYFFKYFVDIFYYFNMVTLT